MRPDTAALAKQNFNREVMTQIDWAVIQRLKRRPAQSILTRATLPAA